MNVFILTRLKESANTCEYACSFSMPFNKLTISEWSTLTGSGILGEAGVKGFLKIIIHLDCTADGRSSNQRSYETVPNYKTQTYRLQHETAQL